MSDIIQDAKQLQSELQSERADWVRERGGENIEMPLDCTVMYEDEEAREMIQALSEETWEYGVEYKYLTNRGAEWQLDPSAGWHKAYRAAERAANASVQFRIVRRRVSPPEVINE